MYSNECLRDAGRFGQNSRVKNFDLGSVGVIDALGFKGIWERQEVDDVIASLLEAKKSAVEIVKAAEGFPASDVFHASGCFPQISSMAFSDTVVFSVTVPQVATKDRSATLAGTAGVAAFGLAYIQRAMAQAKVPLVFRGVIATGDCYVDPATQIMLGPAVDEAANLMNQADGAFVWLSEKTSALDFFRWKGGIWADLFVSYSVPLKGGQPAVRTKVVNPFFHTSHLAEEFEKMRLGYRAAMNLQRADVNLKRQNTEAFIAHVRELSVRHIEMMARNAQVP